MSSNIRQPVIVSVGHVDAGKTSLLDKIRGTAISAKEAGGITQCIGCSHVPLSTIRNICGELLTAMKIDFTIPGLLFIDTPGHAAFTNLRKRGGNLADIAIVVIDINEGFKEQTFEAIDILKSFKTPFVVAANKIDMIPGWIGNKDFLLNNISKQSDSVKGLLDTKLYNLVGKLSELGFNSERFDRVEDFTKQVGIIPCCAKTGEGIPELLMVISGLAQRYLESSLQINVSGNAKGTVLEVKKEKGLGTTLDVIVYDGILKKGDIIVVGGIDSAVVSRVKALFEPAPLTEMRALAKFLSVAEVAAASGVKVSAIDVGQVVAGAPLRSCQESEIEKVKEEVQSEVNEVIIDTAQEGVVVKADTLGSLEALVRLLKERGISVKRALIGDISRKDVMDAEANFDKSPLNAAVLGFNVQAVETDSKNVKVLVNNVIYRLIDELEAWQAEAKKSMESRELDVLVRPAKFKILQGYVFRQNNPAVFGVEILSGVVNAGMPVMKEGKQIGTVKSLQLEQESISSAEAGKRVAVSMDNVTVGRQVNEGDVIYSFIPEEDFRKLKSLAKHLSKEEISVVKEIAEFMRKDNPMWGI